MKVTELLTAFCLLLATSASVHAQSSTDQMIKDWQRAKAYTKEYLDAMTDSGYNLKPTPEMRSFAEQMLHLTDANYGFGSQATGIKSPYGLGDLEKKTTDKSKANVTKLVMAGYDFVIDGIKQMKPAQFNEKIQILKYTLTKQQALEKDFEHQTHHRGQTTVYLRLAGVKPPQEMLFDEGY